jgi:hypothetical protein
VHRYETPGRPGLWWIADADTAGLRGCDVRGTGLDTAAALVRSASATRVTAELPVEDIAGLQQRVGPEVQVATGAPPTGDGASWAGLRARTRAGWQQEALSRACVSVALERALAYARAVSSAAR